jgi:hypothetical protein
MYTIDQQAKQQQMIEDDAVYFGGRVRTNTIHLIAGAVNKGRKSTTMSICGKSVSNMYREPNRATEKVCKFCDTGRQATGFSRINQPRDCVECGKKFADSSEDSNDALCPPCYENAGRENAHLDGEHRDEADQDCPSCRQEAAAAEQAQIDAETAQQAGEDERYAAQVALAVAHEAGDHCGTNEDLRCMQCQQASDDQQDDEEASLEHRAGQHAGQLHSDCTACAETIGAVEYDSADEPLSVRLPETAREILVGAAVHDTLAATQDMARKLREMAERLTLAGQQMVQGEADPIKQAAGALRELNWLLTDLNGPDLILIAQRLQQAREA